MPEQSAFANRAEVEVSERADGVVVRRLVQGAGLDLTEYTVPRGFTTGSSDSELSDKAGYVVRGRVEISTPNGAFVVEAGGAYAIPRGVPHQFTVLEDSVMVQVRHPSALPSPART
jgi:quercetin dioxygenase-like cupin family protein